MNDSMLTTKQAYLAMYQFLVDFYRRTKSDDVGSLLGGMSYLEDGHTADPAVWADWVNCVQKTLSEETDAKLIVR
jgi:hypothetical protein